MDVLEHIAYIHDCGKCLRWSTEYYLSQWNQFLVVTKCLINPVFTSVSSDSSLTSLVVIYGICSNISFWCLLQRFYVTVNFCTQRMFVTYYWRASVANVWSKRNMADDSWFIQSKPHLYYLYHACYFGSNIVLSFRSQRSFFK